MSVVYVLVATVGSYPDEYQDHLLAAYTTLDRAARSQAAAIADPASVLTGLTDGGGRPAYKPPTPGACPDSQPLGPTFEVVPVPLKEED